MKNPVLQYERCSMLVAQAQLSPNSQSPLGDNFIRESHTACRATRLVGDSERFLQVSFHKSSKADEKTKLPLIQSWLEKYTKEGFSLSNGRRYSFFGYTEHHLKQERVLFFHEDAAWTVEKLKKELGDLDTVYEEGGYGKYCIALGLSFIPTVAVAEISAEQLVEIPDEYARDGTLTSDGCGLIRDSYAHELCFKLGIDPSTSVFQISVGGIVGAVSRCLDDDLNDFTGDPSPPALIAYRASMKKYDGGPLHLEILNTSCALKSARLNRSLIYILSTLGVPLEVFESLLKSRLREIDSMKTDYATAIAYVEDELDMNSPTDSYKQELHEMILAGQSLQEPRLMSLITRFRKQEKESLKRSIPVKDAFELIGIMDDSPEGILEEGQVYINLPHRGGPQIGNFIVAPQSIYAPADLRPVEGVNAQCLSHLHDCIVFSRKGRRSEINKMGGGKLDGSLYYVILSPLLVPTSGNIVEPRQQEAPVRSSRSLRQSLSNAVIFAGRWALGYGLAETGRTTPRAPQSEEAINVYVNFHRHKLTTRASKLWFNHVAKTPTLAKSPLCQDLVSLIEAGFDYTRGNSELDELEARLSKLEGQIHKSQSKRRSSSGHDPVHYLQSLISGDANESSNQLDGIFTVDPDLNVQGLVSPQDWRNAIRDARRYLDGFTEKFKQQTARSNINEAAKVQIQEGLQYSFREQHFTSGHALETTGFIVKASAWYYVGYENQNIHFAWAGARYLNYLKASKISKQPPISVSRPTVRSNLTLRPTHTNERKESREIRKMRVSFDKYTSSDFSSSSTDTGRDPKWWDGASVNTSDHITDGSSVVPRFTLPTNYRSVTIKDEDDSAWSQVPSASTPPKNRIASTQDSLESTSNSIRSVSGHFSIVDPYPTSSPSTSQIGVLGSDETNSRTWKTDATLSSLSQTPSLSARPNKFRTSSNHRHLITESAPVFGTDRQIVPPRHTVSAPLPRPKNLPLAPAALEHQSLASCEESVNGQHDWSRTGSNASVRKYRCKNCQLKVEERPDPTTEAGWVPRKP